MRPFTWDFKSPNIWQKTDTGKLQESFFTFLTLFYDIFA